LAAFTVVREEVAPVPSGVVTRATASAARPASAIGCPTPFLIWKDRSASSAEHQARERRQRRRKYATQKAFEQ
jgi:hypothetical protein